MAEAMDEDCLPMRQELTCPVCYGIFRDPVLLPCTHSFCQECLGGISQTGKKCPVCRAVFKEEQVTRDRALSNACEVFLKQTDSLSRKRPSEDACKIHWKPLELFCEKDEEPLCVDCVSLHNTHRLWSLRDGVPLCKKELSFKIEIFEKKVESYKRMADKLKYTVEHIKCQAQKAEKQIKDEFERLRQVLDAEEKRRLHDLAAEEEQKIRDTQGLIVTTKLDIGALNKLIDTLKKEMGNEDVTLLQNFKDLKRKAEWTDEDPCLPPDCLLNMGKHVGALGFKIWKDMQAHVNHYSVVLDPNTASPWLSLSDDLTSVKESLERLTVPENPERFDPCVFVLGAEGYTSGKHKWDVIVGDSPKWIVGVCKESVFRKKKFTVSTNRGVWAIGLSKGVYTVLTPERTELEVKQRPRRIRVKLNIDKGDVSFWDGDLEKHLISFTHEFDGKIFPIFGPGLHSVPMSLDKGKIIVHTA